MHIHMGMTTWNPCKTTVNGMECSAFTDGSVTIAYDTYKDKDDNGVFFVTEMVGDLPEGIGLTEGGEVHHTPGLGFGKTKAQAVKDFSERLFSNTSVAHDCESEGC